MKIIIIKATQKWIIDKPKTNDRDGTICWMMGLVGWWWFVYIVWNQVQHYDKWEIQIKLITCTKVLVVRV